MNIITPEDKMSSRELANLYSKPHNDTLKKIRKLEKAYVKVFGGKGSFSQSSYINSQNKKQPEILLNKSQALFVASRFDAVLHAKVQKRWEDLENKTVAIPNFSNPAEAARAWAIEYERAERAEATKAQIGHKREATAMNTASQAVKKVNRLELELDRSKEYITIKRMTMIYHGQKFNWRILRKTSANMGRFPIDVFDQNYGTVKAYHKDVWQEAYAVSADNSNS